MNTITMINQIPINQKRSATPQLKRYLLEKIREIRSNRKVIEKEAREQRRKEILDAYKKSTGLDKVQARLKKLEKEIRDLREKSLEYGLDSNCDNVVQLRGENDNFTYINNKYYEFNPEQLEKIRGLRKLLDAVEKEVGIFSPMDQMETRMMMASTVGECMAIVNGVAGRDVFAVDAEQLKLTNGQ